MLWHRTIPKIISLPLIVRVEHHIVDMHAELGQTRGLDVEMSNGVHTVPMIICRINDLDIVVAAVIVALYKLNVVLVYFCNQYLIQIKIILTLDSI